jgi:hypothetical protein
MIKVEIDYERLVRIINRGYPFLVLLTFWLVAVAFISKDAGFLFAIPLVWVSFFAGKAAQRAAPNSKT